MKPKTYFKLDNKRQLEQMHDDYKHQFDLPYETLEENFDNGINILQCNEFSVIKLDNEVHPRSTQIDNPFHIAKDKPIEDLQVEFEKVEANNRPKPPVNRTIKEGKAVKKTLKDISEAIKKAENKHDARRERIDFIIDNIGLNVESDVLSKLIEVFDLELEYGEEVQIKHILQLRDN